MGILRSEGTSLFHVPYGPSLKDGNWEASFIDLKTHPDLISVLPPCVGWPETQALLQQMNAKTSPFMSLAADQSFAKGPDPARPVILVSFATFCFAEISHNTKDLLSDLTQFLQTQMDDLLQEIANALGKPIEMEIVLELQPTRYHYERLQGWSVTVMTIVSGHDYQAVRGTWGWGIQAFMDALKAYAPEEEGPLFFPP